MTFTIQRILASADVVLSSAPVTPHRLVNDRAELSRVIAASYPSFEQLRDGLLNRKPLKIGTHHASLLGLAQRCGLIRPIAGNWEIADKSSLRYLTGGWLEEYVALATLEVGADEVLLGQKVRWRVEDYTGENEIDVMARFGSRMFMCSCKALKSTLAPEDARTRERLMHALHEADNLADHFAPSCGIVALAVTTDLMDEEANVARYQQLHGKAAALRVALITLDQMSWTTLTNRLMTIVAGAREDVSGMM